MESKFDYMTLTLKSKTKSFEDALNVLSDDLLLGDLINKMVCKGRAGFYDYHLTYENIEFLLTVPERFDEQGFCLKFSSHGLDYFNKYLKSYNLTLKKWLFRWRALAFEDYTTKCTRLDYAMDDIVKGPDGCPAITMSNIVRAVNNGEICKRARTMDILCGAEISVRERIKYCAGEPIRGRTVYLGVRQSDTLIRFYDKLAEQIQRKLDVPADVSYWTRCEVEFHAENAMSVLNAFLDYPYDEFSKYMCGVVRGLCRFISKKKNDSNISRCPTKRWWTEFLNGCTSNFKLPHKAPARSSLARAERGLRQYVRTVYTLFQELGLEGIYRFFENEVDQLKAKNKDLIKPDILENLREDIRDYEEMTSQNHYYYNSAIPSLDDFDEVVRRQNAAYRYYVRVHDRELHAYFMEGQESLLL